MSWSVAKTERNAEVVAAYLAGDTFANMQGRFSISPSCICRIVQRAGVARTREQRLQRIGEMSRVTNANPAVRASRSAKMREHYRAGRVRPRTPIFEHDPVRREEYLTLRDCYGAAYARQAMGLAA